MSKTIGVFFILLSFSIVSYAITYLHVDGADETVITPPAYFTVTADLSSAGRMLVIEVYADENLNRNPDPYELGNYLGVIDGVPSIGWLADHIYIPGDDDSLADAQITHTAYMEEIFFPGTTDTVRMFLVATDAGDGSCDTALVHILPPSAGITPEPPYAYGHVYSSADSTPIAGAFCVPTDLDVVVFSDSSGRFAFHVPERDSSYQMTAIPADTIHGASATATFSFGASDDSVEADVYCPVYTNHVRGTVTIDGTTPIPGFIIIMGYGAGSAAAVADPAAETALRDPACLRDEAHAIFSGICRYFGWEPEAETPHLTGRLSDGAGTAVPGALVLLDGWRPAQSDHFGRFLFQYVEPGPHQVEIIHRGRVFGPRPAQSGRVLELLLKSD